MKVLLAECKGVHRMANVRAVNLVYPTHTHTTFQGWIVGTLYGMHGQYTA